MTHNAVIQFYKCIQDSQELGSNADHMVSRVFFNLSVDDNLYPELWATIRQAYGGNYLEDPIEVDRPDDYKELLNYEAYRSAVERYYRKMIGEGGSFVSFRPGTSFQSFRMYNNTINVPYRESFTISENSPAW